MAISKGANPYWNGRFADYTVYTRKRDGRVILRQRHNKVGTPTRTFDIMKNRCKWANLVNIWGAASEILTIAYPKKKANNTDYNAFMSENMPQAEVYLTKEMAKLNASILCPLTISSGKLTPSLTGSKFDDVILSNIFIKDLVINKQTTVGEFSTVVLEYNTRIQEGDEILFYKFTQKVNPGNQIPYIDATLDRVELNKDSNKILCQVAGCEGFISYGGHLACKQKEDTMVAWVQSRLGNDDIVRVSTETLVGNNSLYEQYSSDRALREAIESYGGINEKNALKPGKNEVIYSLDDFTDEDFQVGNASNSGTNTGSGTGNTDPTNPSNPSNPGSNPGNPTPSGNIEISVAISPSADMGHVEGAGSYAEGSEVTLKAIPNAGYRFVWWQDNHDQNATRTITVGSENQIYTAVFGEII